MCVLCNDTFSRSDILKRHFQKCSLRRGNPTGISHLSHPHAHLKKAQAAGVVPKPVQGDVSSSIPISNGISGTTFGEGAVNGVSMASSHQPRFTEQQPLGYPMHSVNGMSRGPPDHAIPSHQAHQRSWMAEPKQNSYMMHSGTDTVGQLSVALPPIEASSKNPSETEQKRPVMTSGPNNHGEHIDWSTMLQPGSHENYMNPVFPSSMTPVNDGMQAQVDGDRKFYPASTGGQQQQESGGLNGLYLASTSLGGDGTFRPYPIWNSHRVAD